MAANPLDCLTRGTRARWWKRRGNKERGFRYTDPEGMPVTGMRHITRIQTLHIPPAWPEVRISPSPRSALQAVGLDTTGRVQYIYLPEFREKRDQSKFERIVRFGEALPVLREQSNADIALEGLPRERVLAVVIRLINELYFRLGSEEGVRRYRTYGITTLRNQHLRFGAGGSLIFNYVGKHQVRHRRVLVDAQLSALMRDIKAVGGSRLFEYLDAEGQAHAVTPHDVNAYIKAALGPEFSAKDFRTWGGTLQAAIALAEMGPAETETRIKRNVTQAIKRVAERLGNTPAVCRQSYVHPTVLERYQQGVTLAQYRPRRERAIHHTQPAYEPEEEALLALLRAQC